jgi:hypothetical protein
VTANGHGLKTHWEHVYRTTRTDEVSWFQREPTISLELIRRIAPDRTGRIIDVGGGTSTLVDSLICNRYSALTVLDLSSVALAHSYGRPVTPTCETSAPVPASSNLESPSSSRRRPQRAVRLIGGGAGLTMRGGRHRDERTVGRSAIGSQNLEITRTRGG